MNKITKKKKKDIWAKVRSNLKHGLALKGRKRHCC